MNKVGLQHPFVIAPNANMADHLCHIFGIPRKQIRSGDPETLRGYSRDACFILYTEGWSNTNQYASIVRNLDIGRCTVIFCPEIKEVVRHDVEN